MYSTIFTEHILVLITMVPRTSGSFGTSMLGSMYTCSHASSRTRSFRKFAAAARNRSRVFLEQSCGVSRFPPYRLFIGTTAGILHHLPLLINSKPQQHFHGYVYIIPVVAICWAVEHQLVASSAQREYSRAGNRMGEFA